jgi:ubiquinone/menaquinone biosynthesis C-methylase UbiE
VRRKDLQDGYDRSAPRYDERFEGLQRPKLDAVLARVVPRGRVLDVGCGTGFLARRVPEAVGLDASFAMLEAGHGARVQGDAEALPFRDGSFETAFAITSLLGSVPRALVELHRVLVPGGVLAVTLLAAEVPPDFERELAAAGFRARERFPCGQDVGFVATRSG